MTQTKTKKRNGTITITIPYNNPLEKLRILMSTPKEWGGKIKQ